MRHEYHEVTDTDEVDLGDGRTLVVERHRRRRMKVPSIFGSGAPAAPSGPGRMSAWIVLGTLGILIAYGCYATVSGAYSRELARHQQLAATPPRGAYQINDDGSVTLTGRNGKPYTLRPGGQQYEDLRKNVHERLATGPPEPHVKTQPPAQPPQNTRPKPMEGPAPHCAEIYPLKLNSGTTP
jgi:hypothetical protein